MLAGGCSDGYCIVWDFQSMSIVRKVKCHEGHITSVSWSRNGYCVLSCGDDDKCVYWDLKKGTRKVIEFNCPVLTAQMHPKNNSMFVASLYQESPVIVELGDVIRHFSLPTNSDISSETNGGGDKLNSSNKTVICRYDKKGKRILTGTSQGYLNIIGLDSLEANDEKLRNSELLFAETVNKNNWNQCCFSQVGEYIIGGSAKLASHEIYIWDIRTTRLVQTLQGPYETLIDLAQHPVQPVIVSLDEQGAVHTWTTRHKEDWLNWDPGFTEIHDNIVYEEKEDEFDVLSDEENNNSQNNSIQTDNCDNEEIDVITVDKPENSDSPDEDEEFLDLYHSEIKEEVDVYTVENIRNDGPVYKSNTYKK
ncbi:1925_t:CDS:2 [Diversispora eburnea]|uniref:1925_t:CDS:1 n=1 Tax=Diversispora eburnea TaxID=1213867 RepID=A0A9N8ZTA2_9GLOM|nr:1925_t:CDS:2 [Diversispora eburnea]